MLSPKDIVSVAFTVLFNPQSPPREKKEANEKIMEWSKNPKSIKEAVDLITTSDNDNVIYSCCQVTKNNIVHNYMTYSESDRIAVRNYLCEALIGYQGKMYTRLKIIELVVAIALKDWPESWPSCIDDFISSGTTSPEMCALDFQILSELIVEIHTTDTITETRRKQLIYEFDQYANTIFKMIDWALENVEFESICGPVMKLLKELCLTSPYSSFEEFVPDLLPAIFNVFAQNQVSTEDSIATLTNLLIKRYDAHEITSKLILPIVALFAELCSNEETSSEVLIFIMQFLIIYGPEVDNLCFDGETMVEDVFAQVNSIYQRFIVNPPVEEHVEEYWELWRAVLSRYYRSTKSKNPFEVLKPCYQIFKPLIPDIRQSLYIGFESASEDGKLKNINSQVCWIYVASVDKPGMIEFLVQQTPSVSLCYSIGLIDACLSGKEERDLVIKLFPKLIAHNQQSKDIQFGASLMYAISHIIRFMNKEALFLNAFETCLLNFLASDNQSIVTPAANALFYVSMRHPKLLSRNEDSIIDSVCQNVLSIIVNWELKCIVKVVKAIALVGSSQSDPENRSAIYQQLLQTLSEFLTSSDLDIIQKGLVVITKLTKIKFQDSIIIYNSIFEALIHLLSQAVEVENPMTGEIIDTIVDILLVDTNPTTIANIQRFSEILLQLHSFRDSALLAFARIRSKYDILESIYPQIIQVLLEGGDVIFNLNQNKEMAYPVLRFFRYFSIHQELVSLLLEVCTHFIKDKRLDVSKEALKVLVHNINYVADEQNQANQEANLQLLLESRDNIISSAFICLTDTFHKELFKQVAKLISSFFNAISIASSVYPPDELDKEVTQIIASTLPQFRPSNNPAGEEVLMTFSRALRSHMGDFDAFSSDLQEFLVTANCASPSDLRLFKSKKEIAYDSLEQELMNLLSTEEKGALTAEKELDELEPLLRDFRIEAPHQETED